VAQGVCLARQLLDPTGEVAEDLGTIRRLLGRDLAVVGQRGAQRAQRASTCGKRGELLAQRAIAIADGGGRLDEGQLVHLDSQGLRKPPQLARRVRRDRQAGAGVGKLSVEVLRGALAETTHAIQDTRQLRAVTVASLQRRAVEQLEDVDLPALVAERLDGAHAAAGVHQQ